MKSLKIRMKILVSFGISIVLMLLLSTYVLVSSLNTTANAQGIRNEVDMQTLGAALQYSFLEASKSGAVISSSFNDVEYGNVVRRIAECDTYIAEMEVLVTQYPELEKYAQQVNTVKQDIANWKTNIDEVQNTNLRLRDIIKIATANQLALTAQSRGIFDYQMQLSNEEAGQPELTMVERRERVTRVQQGMDIAMRLTTIGGKFDAMFRALDISKINDDMMYIDVTVTVLEEFLAGSGLQYNIDTTTAMLEAIEILKGNITDFLDAIAARDSATATAFSANDSALATVSNLLASAEAESISFTELTINSNSVALVVIAVIAASALAVSIFMALYLSGIVSNPVRMLTKFMKTASSTGDLEIKQADADAMKEFSKTKDELGELIAASEKFIAHILDVEKILVALANGDLTKELPLLSEKDTIGLSMQRVSGNLNEMFGNINVVTGQVAIGSKQIADGSHALAQSSTEQAGTIEELAASITEISQGTQENAELAKKAAGFAKEILRSAEKGNVQMDEMIEAVGAIQKASQGISKVISVIDDIAFQTNILALNAAVEAARAGEHGKGFAVVADEVRSLAAKSADAAKDTNALIADAMAKAQMGSQIAAETAASLGEIVSGIEKSNELIMEIAKSSETQSQGVVQINNGIDQVTQVVQQTSATAQQSAAAAQQLSGESSMLEQLITRFKLKDKRTAVQRAIAAPAPEQRGQNLF